MFLSHHGLIFGSLQALCQVAQLLNGLSYVLHIARHLLLSKYVDLSLVLSQQGLKLCLPANTYKRVLNYTSPEKFTIGGTSGEKSWTRVVEFPSQQCVAAILNLKSTPDSLAFIIIHTIRMAGKFGGEFKFGDLRLRSRKKKQNAQLLSPNRLATATRTRTQVRLCASKKDTCT